MTLKDIIKVRMLMCCQVLLIAKKQKKITRNNIKRIIIKNTFKKNLINLIHVIFVGNQWPTVLTNQDMKKVESARVLKVKSNWIILI